MGSDEDRGGGGACGGGTGSGPDRREYSEYTPMPIRMSGQYRNTSPSGRMPRLSSRNRTPMPIRITGPNGRRLPPFMEFFGSRLDHSSTATPNCRLRAV